MASGWGTVPEIGQKPSGGHSAKPDYTIRVDAAERKKLCLAREIVWALDAGIGITLVFVILQAAKIAPRAPDVLLRSASYLSSKVHGAGGFTDAAFVVISVAAYGLLAFWAMRLWSRHKRRSGRGPRNRERRRDFRVALAAPVFVYGWVSDEPFSENTKTENVSPAGGLIPVSAKVSPSQELILTNLQTEEDVPCRVARLITRADGQILAGLAFLKSSPSFWEIEFVAGDPTSKMGDASSASQGGQGQAVVRPA
jgi:hypothetical protein